MCCFMFYDVKKCIIHFFTFVELSLQKLIYNRLLFMYVLFRKHFVLQLTLEFASSNTAIPIKYALSRSTKRIIKKCCSSKAILCNP